MTYFPTSPAKKEVPQAKIKSPQAFTAKELATDARLNEDSLRVLLHRWTRWKYVRVSNDPARRYYMLASRGADYVKNLSRWYDPGLLADAYQNVKFANIQRYIWIDVARGINHHVIPPQDDRRWRYDRSKDMPPNVLFKTTDVDRLFGLLPIRHGPSFDSGMANAYRAKFKE